MGPNISSPQTQPRALNIPDPASKFQFQTAIRSDFELTSLTGEKKDSMETHEYKGQEGGDRGRKAQKNQEMGPIGSDEMSRPMALLALALPMWV